jgi:hypothetical protein
MTISPEAACAPIVLLVYRRPESTHILLESLARNPEAARSALYVFLDCPPPHASRKTRHQIERVKEVVRSWVPAFGTVVLHEASVHRGLAGSMIHAVTSVLQHSDRVIVLEDDYVLSPGFLAYMNAALTTYAAEPRVMHINGYLHALPQPFDTPTVLVQYAIPWGWATWRRAWQHFTPDAGELLRQLRERQLFRRYNLDGAYPHLQVLTETYNGRDSWFLPWYACLVLHDGLALFPNQTLVVNRGQDAVATNSSVNLHYTPPTLAEAIPVSALPIAENTAARRKIARYERTLEMPWHRVLKYRILGLLPPWLFRVLRAIARPDNDLPAREKKRLIRAQPGKALEIRLFDRPFVVSKSAQLTHDYRRFWLQKGLQLHAEHFLNDYRTIAFAGTDEGFLPLVLNRLHPHARLLAWEPRDRHHARAALNLRHLEGTSLYWHTHQRDLASAMALTPPDLLVILLPDDPLDLLTAFAHHLDNLDHVFIRVCTPHRGAQPLGEVVRFLTDHHYRIWVEHVTHTPSPFHRRPFIEGNESVVDVWAFRV